MNRSFEYTSSLEYRLKAAHAQLPAFQSGEKYVQMEAQRLREVRTLERTVDGLKKNWQTPAVKRLLSVTSGLRSLSNCRKSAKGKWHRPEKSPPNGTTGMEGRTPEG